MPFFECRVSRTVFAHDLRTQRATEIIYVAAKNEEEAKEKAAHPKNWFRSAGTFGNKSPSFLITVGECKRVNDDKAKTLRPVNPAPTKFHQTPYWGEHNDSHRS
jgi:hypothetical protein